MQLDILTPEEQIYSGEADSVTLPGTDGSFQVLNKHAAMISSLAKGLLKYESAGNSGSWDISGGFVEVLNNKVTVLVEQASEK